MDRLVKADVKEVELSFKRDQKCATTFRLSNLMHTMSVAVNLTTTNPNVFSFSQPFYILPPLSSSSFSLLLSSPSHHPPLGPTNNVIHVRASMLPTGKAALEDLRKLFARPGPHVFRDATIPISFVGPDVVEYLMFQRRRRVDDLGFDRLFDKAVSGCEKSEITALVGSAVGSGDAGLVERLIDAGREVERDEGLMGLAVRSGSVEVVKVLVASGCKVDSSALHDAASMDRVDLAELLFKSFPDQLEVNVVDSDGKSPIHVAAANDHVKMLTFLASKGGDAKVQDRKGRTPLHCAAEKGHLEPTKFLLDHSDVKYVVDKNGKTAFDLASDNGHDALLGLLKFDDALLRSARLDDVNGVKSCLAEGAEVNVRDQYGWTPLHRAAFKGRIESVKVLLNHGAKIDVADEAGYTALHCAVEAGHVQVALLLVAYGARVNVKGLEGIVSPVKLDRFIKSRVMLGSPTFENPPRTQL